MRNLLDVSKLIVQSALERRESRGLHFTTDHLEYVSDTCPLAGRSEPTCPAVTGPQTFLERTRQLPSGSMEGGMLVSGHPKLLLAPMSLVRLHCLLFRQKSALHLLER
jgi:hypothetical protein